MLMTLFKRRASPLGNARGAITCFAFMGMGAALCLALSGTSAQASTLKSVTQTKTVVIDEGLIFEEVNLGTGVFVPVDGSKTGSRDKGELVTFDPFDTSLGVLHSINVSLSMEANLSLEVQSSCATAITIPGFGCTFSNDVTSVLEGSAVLFTRPDANTLPVIWGGTELDRNNPPTLVQEVDNGSGFIGCVLAELLSDEGCTVNTETDASESNAFTLDSGLDAFLFEEIGFALSLRARTEINASCRVNGFAGVCITNGVTRFDGEATASLTYNYALTPVPIPAGLPLLAGAVALLAARRGRLGVSRQ